MRLGSNFGAIATETPHIKLIDEKSKCETAPPSDPRHRYCDDSPDVLHVGVTGKGQLELRKFNSNYQVVVVVDHLPRNWSQESSVVVITRALFRGNK